MMAPFPVEEIQRQIDADFVRPYQSHIWAEATWVQPDQDGIRQVILAEGGYRVACYWFAFTDGRWVAWRVPYTADSRDIPRMMRPTAATIFRLATRDLDLTTRGTS